MSSETWTNAAPGDALERLADDRPRRRAGRSRSSCGRREPSSATSSSLAGVERADADERDARRIERRAAARRRSRTPARDGRAPPRAACRGRCRSASSPACSGRRARRARARRPAPSRDAIPPSVPSAIEWSPPRTSGDAALARRLRDRAGDPLAGRLDLVEEAGALDPRRQPSPEAPWHVAAVGARRGRARRSARRAPRSGSPTAPCRRRGALRRGRARRR